MGSTGTGSFTDYSENRPSNKEQNSSQGGSSGEDKCQKALTVELEEISRCSYFQTYKTVPPVDTPVIIAFEQRLVAKTKDNLIIGYLPTRVNYLVICISSGFSYAGRVSSSISAMIPIVEIDIAAQP